MASVHAAPPINAAVVSTEIQHQDGSSFFLRTVKKVLVIALSTLLGALAGSLFSLVPAVVAVGSGAIIGITCGGAALGFFVGILSVLKCMRGSSVVQNGEDPSEDAIDPQQQLESAAVEEFNRIRNQPDDVDLLLITHQENYGVIRAIFNAMSVAEIKEHLIRTIDQIDESLESRVLQALRFLVGHSEFGETLKSAFEFIASRVQRTADICPLLNLSLKIKQFVEENCDAEKANLEQYMHNGLAQDTIRIYLTNIVAFLEKSTEWDEIEEDTSLLEQILDILKTDPERYKEAQKVLVDLAVFSLSSENPNKSLLGAQRTCLLAVHHIQTAEPDEQKLYLKRIVEAISASEGAAFFKIEGIHTGEEEFIGHPPLPTVTLKDLIILSEFYLRHCLEITDERQQEVALAGFSFEADELLRRVMTKKGLNNAHSGKLRTWSSKQKNSTITMQAASKPKSAVAFYNGLKNCPPLVRDFLRCCQKSALVAIREAMQDDEERGQYLWPDLVEEQVEHVAKEFDEIRGEIAELCKLMNRCVGNPILFKEFVEKMSDDEVKGFFSNLMERICHPEGINDVEREGLVANAETQIHQALDLFSKMDGNKVQKGVGYLLEYARKAIDEEPELALVQRSCLFAVHCLRHNSSSEEELKKSMATLVEDIAQKKGAGFFKFTYTNDVGQQFQIRNFNRFKQVMPKKPYIGPRDLECLTAHYLRWSFKDDDRITIEGTAFHLAANDLLQYMVENRAFMRSLDESQQKFLCDISHPTMRSFKGTLVKRTAADPQQATELFESVRDRMGLVFDLLSVCPRSSKAAIKAIMKNDELLRNKQYLED